MKLPSILLNKSTWTLLVTIILSTVTLIDLLLNLDFLLACRSFPLLLLVSTFIFGHSLNYMFRLSHCLPRHLFTFDYWYLFRLSHCLPRHYFLLVIIVCLSFLIVSWDISFYFILWFYLLEGPWQTNTIDRTFLSSSQPWATSTPNTCWALVIGYIFVITGLNCENR